MHLFMHFEYELVSLETKMSKSVETVLIISSHFEKVLSETLCLKVSTY